MKLTYPAYLIKNIEDNDDSYTIEVPDLIGCVSFGENIADTILMGTDAASGWILGELEDGNEVPSPTPIDKLKERTNAVKTLLVLDMDIYTEKYGEKAIRKNLTIPAWLNTSAENHNINFSEVLQDALKHELGHQ